MNFRRISHVVLGLVAISALGGCSTYGPSNRFLGMSRDQVIAELGQPRPLPENLENAKRLDFPRGPFGKHTYAIYFDESGRVTNFQQLLNEQNFRSITAGMTRNEVIERIGISTDTFLIGRNRGYVWNYRYETARCQWVQIEFTAEDMVRSAGYGTPPECRVRAPAAR